MPNSAVADKGTNTKPIPRLMTIIDGRMCVRYSLSGVSRVKPAIPIVASTNPVKVTKRGPNRGSSWLAIPALTMIPAENGRNSKPDFNGV